MALLDRFKSVLDENDSSFFVKWIECPGIRTSDISVSFEKDVLFVKGEREVEGYRKVRMDVSFKVDRSKFDIKKTKVSLSDGLMRIEIPLLEDIRGGIEVK